MRTRCIISGTLVMSLLVSAASAHEIEMTWTNIQDGYDPGLNLVWVTGNVNSEEYPTPGGVICMGIRYQQEGEAGPTQDTIGENGEFECAVEDPLERDPSPILYVLLAWDATFSHWDGYGGYAE